jgi:hypothetical protein
MRSGQRIHPAEIEVICESWWSVGKQEVIWPLPVSPSSRSNTLTPKNRAADRFRYADFSLPVKIRWKLQMIIHAVWEAWTLAACCLR